MTIHRYPSESVPDYMRLQSYEYTGRASRSGQVGDNTGPAINTYILPFPELPNMVSQQRYGQISGALNNALGTGLGQAYDSIVNAVEGKERKSIGDISQSLKDRIITANGGLGPVAKEMAAQMAGGLIGISSANFQTLASGEITNPNIETLYGGPSLRSYAFNWTLAPKNSKESNNVFEMVKKLKQDHLPSSNQGSPGMLKVPNFFKISLFTDGSESKYYQRFFPCVLESLSVRNDSAGQHFTLPDNSPVISSISMVFKEINTLVSSDFEDGI